FIRGCSISSAGTARPTPASPARRAGCARHSRPADRVRTRAAPAVRQPRADAWPFLDARDRHEYIRRRFSNEPPDCRNPQTVSTPSFTRHRAGVRVMKRQVVRAALRLSLLLVSVAPLVAQTPPTTVQIPPATAPAPGAAAQPPYQP